ncbi:hypothetical protein HDU79_006250 [Rhizoclosmatium sp. JEL0117]|nr:hypothetical protein HDU79_006250 [Rhizoclosmatium sp. JEL0117]
MTLPIIGSYRLMRTIGEGEFGKVKLAVHIETGVEVAIKLCKKSQVVATPNGYTKLMREISTLKLVKNHPFIITLIEVIENETYIAIVMELAKGGELFEHILTKRSLEENETRKLFAQIMSAVGYIHSLEIVHRDLKLENILLDEHQNVVLIDFGFANKTKGPDVLMRTSCGSPCYAAPELVTTEASFLGYIGEKADLWSCGVILFSMIAGYLPWDDDPDNPEGDNINLLYNYIMHTPLDFPDHVPYDCRLLINRILEPNPDKRADIEEIINHVWLQPVKHIFDAEMDRRKNLVANIPIGPGSGSLNSPKLSPTRSSSIAVEQQVPMPAIQGDTSMEASSLPVTPKRGNSGSSTPMIVEQLGISTITPPPTPGSKRVVPADPRVSPISSPTAPIASLSIPYAPNARSTSLVVGEIYGNSERTVSEAETMVAGDDIGSVNPATPGVVVSDRIVVDEPSSFEPAGILQAHSGHHVVDSYSTVANEAMVVDEDQPVYLPKNEKGPQSDIVTDLRGMLTTLSSDNKTLPTTPEVSILKQEERDLSSEITTSSSTDISHNRSKHESRELHPSSFAEFMRKAMDRPLPDLPPEADEISEPRGILRGFTTPLISNDDSSRGSSTKKRVSIQEPSLTLANGNRSSSRASWLSSLTSKLFGKSAEPEALSRDTSAVGVQGRADPSS